MVSSASSDNTGASKDKDVFDKHHDIIQKEDKKNPFVKSSDNTSTDTTKAK